MRAISDMERGQSPRRQATLHELMDVLGLDEDERRRLVRASTRFARAPHRCGPGGVPAAAVSGPADPEPRPSWPGRDDRPVPATTGQ
ncbi:MULTISPECIES: hypothetical protein [unclassified Streptomyces]|uniref:hypothetical protein n=1 Tax=unclassified Streptomyces TaxID=2593676 RepID=UPI0036E099B5